jgi:hypothetical protein
VVLAETVEAVAAKVEDVAPEAIVINAGTDSAWAEEESVTVAPAEGAAAVKVTVHVDVPGDAIVVGLHVNVERTAAGFGLSVKEADFVTPP